MWFAFPRAKTNEALSVKTESAPYFAVEGSICENFPFGIQDPTPRQGRCNTAQHRGSVKPEPGRWYMQQ